VCRGRVAVGATRRASQHRARCAGHRCNESSSVVVEQLVRVLGDSRGVAQHAHQFAGARHDGAEVRAQGTHAQLSGNAPATAAHSWRRGFRVGALEHLFLLESFDVFVGALLAESEIVLER